MPSRPPLTAIFVFCAAARHGSFKRAAEDLCVTPGAVSKQIGLLELYLGHALFERGPRVVQLTRKGRQLQERIGERMNAVAVEIDLLRSGGRKAVVRVEAGVTLAMHWLIPRLPSFAQMQPGIQVQISTADGPIDTAKRMDVHIRRDPADFRGMASQVFLEEQSVLVASQKLLRGKRLPSLRSVGDLARVGATSRPSLWGQWRTFHGLADIDVEPTLEFDNTVLAIQATLEGIGAMVVPEMFVAGMLDAHSLLELDATRVPTGSYAYVVRARRGNENVRKFIDWLQQASGSGGGRPS